MCERCSCSSPIKELFLLNFREQLCGVILLQYGELVFPFQVSGAGMNLSSLTEHLLLAVLLTVHRKSFGISIEEETTGTRN